MEIQALFVASGGGSLRRHQIVEVKRMFLGCFAQIPKNNHQTPIFNADQKVRDLSSLRKVSVRPASTTEPIAAHVQL